MLTAGDHGSLQHGRRTKWSKLPYLKDLGDAAMKEGPWDPLTPYGAGLYGVVGSILVAFCGMGVGLQLLQWQCTHYADESSGKLVAAKRQDPV